MNKLPTETSGNYYEVRITSLTLPHESELVREYDTLTEANTVAAQLHAEGKAAFVRYPSR